MLPLVLLMPPSERGMMELSNHCILAAYSGCGVDWCGTACTTSALKNARGVVNDKVLDSGGACMPLHDERGFFSLTLACSISQPHLYTVSFALERPMTNDANGFGYWFIAFPAELIPEVVK